MIEKNSSDTNGEPLNTVAKDGSSRINLGRILFILVDDVKRAEVDLNKTNSVNFDLTANDKEIKIVADDKAGKMFIERFPLDFSNLDEETASETFQLKTGQKMTFSFTPVQNQDKQLVKINCQLVYDDYKSSGVLGASGKNAATTSAVSKTASWGIAAAFALVMLILGLGWFAYRNFGVAKPEVAQNQIAATQNNDTKNVETATKPESNEATKPETTNDNTNSNSQIASSNAFTNSASNSNKSVVTENNDSSKIGGSVRLRNISSNPRPRIKTNNADDSQTKIIVSSNAPKERIVKPANINKIANQPKTSIAATSNIKAKKVFKNWVNRDVFVLKNADEPTAKNQPARNTNEEVTETNDKSTTANDKTIAANAVPSDEIPNTNGKSLLEIKQIYLDWQGDLELGTKINGQVIEEVQKSGLLTISDKKVADAALRIYVSRDTDETKNEVADKPKIKASMSLINNAGIIVTPNTKGVSEWKYVGELEKLPVQIVKDVKMLTTPQK